ncbi:glucokinase regulatory protein-like isoform X4 [Heterocephalus glaber]|uniref:Glucokinase regulatory protein-like isoform X4 n=1 Tax=Heterocephalus glaber TaxID=10181 RepID=A0AAX6SKW4_HETGA|nr:glucokinase regulatory protein-like isoform X4 [Heterocephalus glaber]
MPSTKRFQHVIETPEPGEWERLYSESVLTTMLQVAGKVQEVLKEPDGGLVVLSGGGTSGWMTFLMSVSTLVRFSSVSLWG